MIFHNFIPLPFSEINDLYQQKERVRREFKQKEAQWSEDQRKTMAQESAREKEEQRKKLEERKMMREAKKKMRYFEPYQPVLLEQEIL